jgi:hypothetical protein
MMEPPAGKEEEPYNADATPFIMQSSKDIGKDMEQAGTGYHTGGGYVPPTKEGEGDKQAVEAAASLAKMGIAGGQEYNQARADAIKTRMRELVEKSRTGENVGSKHIGDRILGKRSSTSEAIAALRKEEQKAPSLGDSSAYGKEYLGSFRVVGDHRFKLVNELEDFKNKLNISFSFSERNLECLCKRGHGDGEGGGAISLFWRTKISPQPSTARRAKTVQRS